MEKMIKNNVKDASAYFSVTITIYYMKYESDLMYILRYIVLI